ncbi:MAG: hypothetical protein MJ000_06940 [Bacteroidales bacterium]|nr:hypothetical protein [Bacteroidales bacterium]
MKKNRIFAIVALLAVIVSSVVVFQACRKNKSVTDQQIIENQQTKPVISYNKKTGQTTTTIDINEFQAKFNDQLGIKGDERYIVAGIEFDNIIDTNQKDGENTKAVKLTVLDTEEEISQTHWFCNGFWEINESGENVDFYLSKDFIDGDFSYYTADENGYYRINVNHGSFVSTDTINKPEMGPLLPWDLSCTTTYPCTACDKDFHSWSWECKCKRYYDIPNAIPYCSGTTTNNTITWGLTGLTIIVMII